ncbi:MAG TPA: ketopantoate reductase family protein [Rhodopila sp.]|uniref:ketopantoate reductase family protein n=1 Tax=Rhodopila sp. TaxID=2480087 RepID=UPI002C3019C7|nr:ketopantoate reductase family protein [Rhodopila sp.]HVY16631.1 ketopantoate reductase family protein [Rhodopila sp.]
MRILIVGAGATGGYFGGRLLEAGRDVTFLVRPGRAEQIRRDGLVIVSPHGDVTLAPKTVLASEIAQPFDIVILAVKAYALEQALADLKPAIGPATMIVPLLNGMRQVDLLVRDFGEAPVLGGVCIVATMLDAQNRVVQLAGMQELKYGERDGSTSDRVRRLHDALSGAGFETTLSTTILQEMWEKWVMLATAGALTCLLRGTVGEIEALPNGADLPPRFLAETAAVAAAAGYPPPEAVLARTRTMLMAKGSPWAPSMYRDLQVNAPVEVEQILADMALRGARSGIATPLLDAATAQLRIYQARRAAA